MRCGAGSVTRLRSAWSCRLIPQGFGDTMLPLDEVVRANPVYVESLYRDWQRDPASVDERWALFFAGYDLARGGTGAPTRAPEIAELVHAYRELGHLVADLDPLGHSPRHHPLLQLEELGFEARDLDRAPTISIRRALMASSTSRSPTRNGARGCRTASSRTAIIPT